MRVLFVAHSFPRFEGDAAGSFLLLLARALKQVDIDVEVVAPSAPGLAATESIGGIRVHRFRYAPRRYETLAYTGTMARDVAQSITAKGAMASFIGAEISATAAAVRRWSPDVVHAHWWFPNGIAGAFAARRHNLPLVITSHGSDVRLLARKPAAAPVARAVFRRADEVTCVSSWLARRVAPYVTGDVTVAPMPVAVDLFEPGSERGDTNIIFVGRLSEQKGIRPALYALALLETDATTLEVIGEGPDRAELVQLARGLGVAERVLWRGTLPQSDVAARIGAAALAMVPSIDEGLGLVAVEAQLCETPVVAFASGGLTDVIVDGRNGVLVPAGDIDALARATDSLLNDSRRRRALGSAGRQSALATFAPEVVAERYAAVYRAAIRTHSKHAA